MQEKTNMVADNSARLGLTINRRKSKVFKTNSSNSTPITVQQDQLFQQHTNHSPRRSITHCLHI
ncbi:hypothetical protein DPMN_075903 [Dreissena polymorpha]|uniref:Uncharacterized protein n=1 Tax=Dreissena polymorpha TaxID=45954 RepID=A0A9D4BPX8_DREPO|nr:hypothetical protein DPMN_075903 [Dreissena polymorpha]